MRFRILDKDKLEFHDVDEDTFLNMVKEGDSIIRVIIHPAKCRCDRCKVIKIQPDDLEVKT